MVVMAEDARLGMSMRFKVVVDDVDLGGWTSCAGLAVEFKNTLVGEGANYETRTVLPDRVEYKVITLKRAMVAQDSAQVQNWLSRVVADWYGATSPGNYGARTARIALFDAYGQEVAAWSLRNVYPAGWQGPDLDASGHAVAVETLQLIHEGFL